jgi:hypothetical protein
MTDFNYNYNPALIDVKKDVKKDLLMAGRDVTSSLKTPKVVMTTDVEM